MWLSPWLANSHAARKEKQRLYSPESNNGTGPKLSGTKSKQLGRKAFGRALALCPSLSAPTTRCTGPSRGGTCLPTGTGCLSPSPPAAPQALAPGTATANSLSMNQSHRTSSRRKQHKHTQKTRNYKEAAYITLIFITTAPGLSPSDPFLSLYSCAETYLRTLHTFFI